jgi:hypothetical protein
MMRPQKFITAHSAEKSIRTEIAIVVLTAHNFEGCEEAKVVNPSSPPAT